MGFFPPHDPVDAIRVCPTCAVPLIVGGDVGAGGSPPAPAARATIAATKGARKQPTTPTPPRILRPILSQSPRTPQHYVGRGKLPIPSRPGRHQSDVRS